ncbi:hypothetical protein NDU88_005709 [Pleurodeles waltl]|uniref:Uncharacterized protein n=1 Tax=Pleurodeles waltl TaxID=8319 RepID=A0AAV7SMM4_PLEWA|nr:hypothetical protein NDU88_005709 [Pleurodeles waltl]
MVCTFGLQGADREGYSKGEAFCNLRATQKRKEFLTSLLQTIYCRNYIFTYSSADLKDFSLDNRRM